ncbi:uncharacterized protein JN550_006364 [Neoarthrinium moseri]|uniref:uncharacterized protein n=1 Tax=Neoarthrinium moseri TaxID=1658444 RepID=UPI001FDB8CD6|nr:uncharacterized protein JN550_006364 [Neoarthrinium moseri]KAI1868448.1 hypothetical protein JN550_006364 [Neoarthrinium moseri]
MSFDTGYWTTPSHVIAAGIGLSILDIAFVSLRFAARKKQRQPLKADDWLLVPATLLNIGIGIAMVYGVSRHSLAYPFEVPAEADGNGLLVATEQISLEGKIQWAYTLMLPLALGFTKASFVCFYRRIFAVNRSSKTNIFLVGMIVFIIIWMAAFFFAFLFQCRLNFWALWTSPIAILEHCVSDTPINFALTITDVVTDVIILITPIPLVWRLKLTSVRKLAVTAVFLLGAVTVLASIVRLAMTTKILQVGFDPNVDAILTSFIYWGMAESGIAVFVACLPTLWILFKGWSWNHLVRVARSIADSSLSSLRLIRTRTSGSKEDLATGYSVNGTSLRKLSTSTPSESPFAADAQLMSTTDSRDIELGRV